MEQFGVVSTVWICIGVFSLSISEMPLAAVTQDKYTYATCQRKCSSRTAH
jgi:hypothetical protein